MAATLSSVSRRLSRLALALALAMGVTIPARALGGQPMFDPQSDGSDGALVVDQNTVINLALAPTGSWMDPAPLPGLGVYDPTIWAVVFKYESVQINAGTVSFLNHPSGAPVVWLVEGAVVVAGNAVVNLDGKDGTGGSIAYPQPGPGGFAGGRGGNNNGFGPGAGNPYSGGQYAAGSRAYGSLEIRPLIGGSGGGAGGPAGAPNPGGAGGGAIMIGADTIVINGFVVARGGNGGSGGNTAPDGSGGAIRLVANVVEVVGDSRLNVTPAFGSTDGAGDGRIRIEAFRFNISASAPLPGTFPFYTTALPGPLFQDEFTPTVRLAAVNGVAISDDPLAGVQSIDAGINDANSTITLTIHAWNVEPGSIIEVKAQQAQGTLIVVQSTPLEGSIVFSTATANIALNSGIPADIVLRVLP